MQTLSRTLTQLGIAMLLGIASPVFAESAPVYDVDSMPQPFDDQAQAGNDDQAQSSNDTQAQQDLPPPPPPAGEGAFVPAPQQQASTNAVSTTTGNLSLEQRMKRIEIQLDNMGTSDAAAKIDSLQTQVQTLRGQVDELTRQLQKAQEQQKAQFADLDKRVSQTNASTKTASADNATATTDDNSTTTKSTKKAKAAKTAVAATVGAPSVDDGPVDDSTGNIAKSSDTQPNVAEEQQIYQTAYNLIKAKKYEDAVTALEGMLKKYPSGQFASNAHYWLGELYGLMGKNDKSLAEFNTVVQTFPASPRVSDAQLKVGLILATQTKWSDAKAAFKKVINHYPGTASARLASEQLKQIKTAGH